MYSVTYKMHYHFPLDNLQQVRNQNEKYIQNQSFWESEIGKNIINPWVYYVYYNKVSETFYYG